MIRITLVQSVAPRKVLESTVHLPAGAVLKEALPIAVLKFAEEGTLQCGIWGRAMPLNASLQDGDRIEVYRPLQVDPKVARRQRFASQGARTAGLFASRRSGAKAGY
jgi:putative ubiquitin-RnfH superfamily antitoxin RatB of RatAB toxin-antitoxin module